MTGATASIEPRHRFFPALPEEAPLAMPVQSLRAAPRALVDQPAAAAAIGLRRALVIGGTAVLAAFGASEMYRVLEVSGVTILEALVLLLYVPLFAWIAFALVSAVGGFLSLVRRGGLGLGIDPAAPLPALQTRTAILMPTYNESPERVMAGLQAVHESLDATGRLASFDLFILSDTTDPEVWIAEEAAFLALRARTGGDARIFYRRRPKNSERKAGNIAEWVRRFGGRYAQMLILDADSVMSGDTIVRMAAAMERHPDVGLIQTLPIIVNGTTRPLQLIRKDAKIR